MRLRKSAVLFAIVAEIVWSAGFNLSADEKTIPYPEPLTLDKSLPDGEFVLAGPENNTIIIYGDKGKYQFPYWGGDFILSKYLHLMTGVDVPRRHYAKFAANEKMRKKYKYRIWVGRQPAVEKAIGAELAKLDDDGFIIKCVGNDLYISGKTKYGTHYAPYDIFERALGCRFYQLPPPIWDVKKFGRGLGDIIPELKKAAIPANTFIVENPDYKGRWYRIVPSFAFRVRRRDNFSHNIVIIMPPAKYAKKHPEYFPMINGKRFVPPPSRAYDFQPCISNPDVKKLFLDAARAYFKRNPDASCFSIGMNDSGKYCQCPECLKMSEGMKPPADMNPRLAKNAKVAYRWFKFYNSVAEDFAKEFPTKRLGCLAYAVLSALPKGTMKLHPSIVPYLTRDSAQLFDPHEVKEFRETVDRWKSLCSRMGIYEYLYGGSFMIPRIYNRYLLKNIKDGYGVNCDGFYGEAYPNWGLDGPKYWMIAKMLWHRGYDPKQLLDDYCSNMFGAAAGEMKKYFEYLEDVWCNQKLKSGRSNYRWYASKRQFDIFTPDVCEAAMAMLDKALAKADSPDAKRRISFFKRTFKATQALSERREFGLLLSKLAKENPPPIDKMAPYFKRYLDTGNLRPIIENAFKDTGLCGYGAGMTSYSTLMNTFDTVPNLALRNAGYAIVDQVLKNKDEKSLDAKIVDAVSKSLDAGKYPGFAKLLESVAKRGILKISRSEVAPVIDGTIEKSEWGEPAFSGKFFKVFKVNEKSPFKTTVWARVVGRRLYMAFDCEAGPEMGSSLKSAEDDLKGVNTKIRLDDSISVCFKAKGRRYIVVAFNTNGVIKSFVKKAVVKTKVEKGRWTAEVDFGMDFGLGAGDGGPVPAVKLPITRYYRVLEPAGFLYKNKMRTVAKCSTLFPCSKKLRGVIGAGDFPALMAFVSGPIPVIEKSKPEPPAEAKKSVSR